VGEQPPDGRGAEDGVKIPYALTPAVPLDRRYANMEAAIARGLPRLTGEKIDERVIASIACYGPSLADTWRELRHPIISMSGATKWLAERGVIVDYHVDMDPRPCQIRNYQPVIPGVTYLIASVCDPAVFDVLAAADAPVILWHTVSSNEKQDLAWVARHDDGALLVIGGSTIGLTAIQLGGVLGHRRFEIHGMDGSFRDAERHAGAHADPKRQKNDITWAAGGRTYRTSRIMANAVAETINQMGLYPIFTIFHGDGLTQALIKEANHPNSCTADQVERAEFLRKRAVVNFVDVSPKERAQVPAWSVWEAICFSHPDPHWLDELQVQFAIAEHRRPLARFNTGSIPLETGLLLRAVCAWRRPKVAVEIGTFIGKSTLALQADVIYTCDKDNDCLPCTRTIRTHPYTTSTALLERLVAAGVAVDLFFFDGRLSGQDVSLIKRLATAATVYCFDDFHEGGKGLANWRRLQGSLPQHGLVEPYPMFAGRSTLALAVPVVTPQAAVA
jgi:6-hydroxymethylpterin diphosphokinase MptE-like protein